MEEVRSNAVIRKYNMYYLSLYILGFIMVNTMLQTNNVVLMIGLLLASLSLYIKWLENNRNAQNMVYKQIKELAIKSEEEYRERRYHLLYSVKTMTEDFEGTIEDLTYVLADLMDSGVINVHYSADDKTGKTEAVYALEKSPAKAQFRKVSNRKIVSVEDLKVAFNEDYAKYVYDQRAKERA